MSKKDVPSKFKPINANEVFKSLKESHSNGSLKKSIMNGKIVYQASLDPEYLEQVHPDGTTIIGKFIKGDFVPI